MFNDRLRKMQPLYLQLVEKLAALIVDGKLPVGGYLPTEAVLREQYSVSRHTVRAAIQKLQELGLVVSKHGIGTLVVACEIPREGRYTASFHSIDDLIIYTRETVFTPLSTTRVKADETLAGQLSCRTGEEFLSIVGVRTSGGETDMPVSLHRVYVARGYEDILAKLPHLDESICSTIARLYDIEIDRISQIISPIILDQETADQLDAPAGDPATQILRAYYATDGQVIEYAFSIYHGEHARINMNLAYEK